MISGQLGPSRHQGRTGTSPARPQLRAVRRSVAMEDAQHRREAAPQGDGEVGVLACRPREGPTAADVTLPTRYLPRAGWSVPVPQAVAVPYVPSPFPSPAISRCCGPLPLRPSCARFHRGAEPVIEQPESQPNVSRLRALEPLPEQGIGVQRYGNALRRSRGLIAAIVLGLTALVLWVSLMLPKTYTAQATILLNEVPTVTATTDEKRQLATIQ